MTRPEPAWRKVACPRCGSKPGENCTRLSIRRILCEPHAARVRLATQQPATSGTTETP